MADPLALTTPHFNMFPSTAEEDAVRATTEECPGDSIGAPRNLGTDWALVLSVTMMRTLEYRLPGFIDDVQKRLKRSAEQTEDGQDPDYNADAASVRGLLASWVFTQEGSFDVGLEP